MAMPVIIFSADERIYQTGDVQVYRVDKEKMIAFSCDVQNRVLDKKPW